MSKKTAPRRAYGKIIVSMLSNSPSYSRHAIRALSSTGKKKNLEKAGVTLFGDSAI